MKLSLVQMMMLAEPISKLSEQDLPGDTALKLYDIANAIEHYSAFRINEEKKLIEKYGAVADEKSHVYEVPDPKKDEEFRAAVEELRGMIIDKPELNFISRADLAKIKLSMLDIRKLQPIVAELQPKDPETRLHAEK